MSSPLAGAEMITLRAPAARWARASSALVNRPVDSTTTSTPRSAQGRADGSRSARTRISWSPVLIASPSASTSTSSVPSTVSYFSRCASVAASVRSLATTISSPAPAAAPACTARQKLRPIRPNPLMPTRTVTAVFSSLCSCLPRARGSRGHPYGTLSKSGHQHVRGQVRLGAGDPEFYGAPVSQRQQPADPAGDRVLGQRRVGKLAEFLQARLAVLDPQLAGHDQVLRRLVTEDLQSPLHPGACCDGGPGAAPQVGVVEVGQPVRGRAHLAAHPPVLPRE